MKIEGNELKCPVDGDSSFVADEVGLYLDTTSSGTVRMAFLDGVEESVKSSFVANIDAGIPLVEWREK